MIPDGPNELTELNKIMSDFSKVMQNELEKMWSAKLGLKSFDANLFQPLINLMIETKVDYTIFFRELSHLPKDIRPLKISFYGETSKNLDQKWEKWLMNWHEVLTTENDGNLSDVSKKMTLTNPKYTFREWLVVSAYNQAEKGDYSLVRELQEVLASPYEEQSKDIEAKFYRLKPKAYFNTGGISHYSCSS